MLGIRKRWWRLVRFPFPFFSVSRSKVTNVCTHTRSRPHAIATDSAVLGISSIIKAFPYEVPPFIPSVLIECMSKHAASPVPLSTTVRATLADFKRTHADSWETDQKAFSAEQLADLQDLLTGSVRTLFFFPSLIACSIH